MIHRLPRLLIQTIALILSANAYSYCGVQSVEKENDGVLIRFNPDFSPEFELLVSTANGQANQEYKWCKISKGILRCRGHDFEYLLLRKEQTASVSNFYHQNCVLTVVEKSNQAGVLAEEFLTFVALPSNRSEVFFPAK